MTTREGGIRVKFERNFTENNDQGCVELRIKDNGSTSGYLEGCISAFVIISPGRNISQF